MPSIALFSGEYANEKSITDMLSSGLDLSVVNDADIINHVCSKNLGHRNKLEQCLYQKTSVFNHYTLERERNAARLKFAMALKLSEKKNYLYSGFTSLLIPADITHVLNVLLIDSKERRISRARAAESLSEKDAASFIKVADQKAYGWAEFLYQKEAFDPSLYDIVIPVENKSPEEIVALIKENFNKTSVLETEASIQAVRDFAITAQVEQVLLAEGQKVEVETRNSRVTLKVNKSTFSFSRLSDKLTKIAESVAGIQGVEVKQGKGYSTSVYRDQHFELPPKVLLVDDEKEYVLTLSERLVSRNVGSHAVFNGQEALNLIDGDQPDVMVLDLKMPGIDGIEVLKRTKKNNPKIEVIVLTGHGSVADEQACMNLGAYAYLQKPTDIDKLSATIAGAYKKINDGSRS